jgi:hypothetical protein
MSRLLSLTLAVAVALPLFAQGPVLLTFIRPERAIVDAGASITFETSVSTSSNPRPTDLRVVYEVVGDGTIERLELFNGWTCAIESKTAVCTNPFAGLLSDTIHVVVRAGTGNGVTATLKMTATAAQPTTGNRNAQATLLSPRVIPVVTSADSGPGSFRAAIEEANGVPAAKIEFQLPVPVPTEGWFTITPESPLPAVTTENVFIDGHAQTRLTGDTNPRGPEIAIDGRRAHRGLEVHSPCMARVHGLVLGHFDANQGLWFTKGRPCPVAANFFQGAIRDVADNYIGTDPTGTTAWPNLRGLRGDFGSGTIRNNVISGNTYSGIWIWAAFDVYESFTIEANKIGTGADGVSALPNGAAGMLLGDRVAADVLRNTIANHPGMGVALARGETYVQIRENSMRDNGGIGIDWGVDGISPLQDDQHVSQPNAPTLLSARYDAGENRTYFTVVTTTATFNGPIYLRPVFDFYANRGPNGDGEQWLSLGGGRSIDERTFEGWVAGDYRGKWVNATLTRQPDFGFARTPGISSEQIRSELITFGDESTSEFSPAILVP